MPDKWKEGASNVAEGGGRKVNENKLLSKKQRYVLGVQDAAGKSTFRISSSECHLTSFLNL